MEMTMGLFLVLFALFVVGLLITAVAYILMYLNHATLVVSGFIWKHIGFVEIVAIVVCCLLIGLAIYLSADNEIKKIGTRIRTKIRNVLLDTIAVVLCNGINALLVICLFFQCGKYTRSDWYELQFQIILYTVIWLLEFLFTIGIMAMYFGMQMFFLINKESAFFGPSLAIIYFIVLHYIIYFLYNDTVVDVLSGLPWLQNLFSAPLHRLISSFFTSIF